MMGSTAGLSATTVTRLKATWEQQYKDWSHRSLADQRYVYLWADGVYFNVRLEDPNNTRQCILVLMGATAQDKKELIAVTDGYRKSEQSWQELLLEVKARGLTIDPKLTVGDTTLGFWAALAKVFPATRVQRYWVHKTANMLNKMPNAVKFETFVFDALPMCEQSIVLETERVEEFAPIKNAEGVDSAQSSSQLQTERAAVIAQS